MSRPLTGSLPTSVAETFTEPTYLVFMDFDTPVYLSSRGQISYGGNTYLAADLSVRLSETPTLSILNESTTLGAVVLVDGTAGRAVKIYQQYGSDTLLLFDGEMGEARIGVNIVIGCRKTRPLRTPRLHVGPPVFNWVPKKGARFETPKGTVILE